jgi:hypothetical protein
MEGRRSIGLREIQPLGIDVPPMPPDDGPSMSISGILIADGHYSHEDGTQEPPTTWNAILPFVDSPTLIHDAHAGEYTALATLGGYPWIMDVPFTVTEGASQDAFSDLNHSSLIIPAIQWNTDTQFIRPPPYTVLLIDDTYPNMNYSWPGLLTADIFIGDSMDIEWTPHSVRLEDYAAMIVAITTNPAIDLDIYNEPINLESGDALPAPISNVGTSSPALVTSAADFAASGKGAFAIGVIAWDDIAQVPTLPSGWVDLGHYADSTTGWAGMFFGRAFFPGDAGPYTMTATFSSSVKSTGNIDTWQSEIVV